MPRRGAALLALAAIVMGGCGSGGENPVKAPSHPPAGRKPVIFEPGPLELTGDARDQTLDEIAAMGVDRVRMVVFWSRVLPVQKPGSFDGSDPGDPAYDFSAYDSFMRAAAERGFKVLVTISGLGRPGPTRAERRRRPPDVSAFGDFARAVATRYSGHFSPASGGGELPAATMWSVWNEPNLSLFLKPQYVDGRPYSPILYRHLFIAAAGRDPRRRSLGPDPDRRDRADREHRLGRPRPLCARRPLPRSGDRPGPLLRRANRRRRAGRPTPIRERARRPSSRPRRDHS